MKKIIISAFTFIFIGLGTAAAQQIPMFNSYILNQFLLNPSYAGIDGKTNLYALNRVQFIGFEGAPITYMLAGDAGFKNKKFGLGGVVFSNQNNIIAQTGFQLAYSYNLKLNDQWNLGMGINAGLVQWALDFDQLRVEDPSENFLSNAPSNATTFRSDIGFRLNSNKIDIGLVIPQAVSSKVNYTDYMRNTNGKYISVPHFIANFSYLVDIKEGLKLKPMVLVRGAKGVKPQIDLIGLLDWHNKAYASVGYRSNFAMTIGGGFRLQRGITIGYNFDRPVNAISTVTAGSHEFVVGITFGSKSKSEDVEESKGLTKEAEAKLKADMEKQIRDKLSLEFENKLKLELDSRINKTVDEKITKALEKIPATTTSNDGKTTTTAGSISKEDLDKIKKDIEEKSRKQIEESLNKTVDEKIKKAIESNPSANNTTPKVSKEEADKIKKETEDKIRKQIEESLKKEMVEKINKAVEERMALEAQKAKEAALKSPPEYKMTPKDKAMLDSLKMKELENEKRIAELEKQLKIFPDNARVENMELTNIKRIAHQDDIELKKMKTEKRAIFDATRDTPSKKSKNTEPDDENGKFVIVLATFKTLKEAQQFQKIATQTFEFPNTKILSPSEMVGWFFVYQKSSDNKKEAFKMFEKVFEGKFETPVYPWIYVIE